MDQMREMLSLGQVNAGDAARVDGSQDWKTVADFVGGAETAIHINQDGQQSGPFMLDKVNALLAAGSLKPTASAFCEGMKGWVAIAQIPGVVMPVEGVQTSKRVSPIPGSIAGKKNTAGSAAGPQKTDQPKQGKSRIQFIGIGVAGIAIVGGLIWFLFFRGSGSGLDSGNPDHQAIEAAIREAIAKPEGELTEDDFKKVKKLALIKKKLKDITPLAKLKSLEELNLTGNELANLEPLSGLELLKTLNLSANKLNDVKHLEALKNMETLDLSGNQISDATPLAGLSRIVDLNLGKNKITDAGPLGKLTLLEYLDIEKNQVVNAAPLAGLTVLRTLNLQGNGVKDISLFSKSRTLKMLMIGGNPVTKESVENLRKEMKDCVIN